MFDAGRNIYLAYTQQFTPPLNFRDREACYVIEPNGNLLGPAIYDCRLVGSYPPGDPLALPLYATTCCGTGQLQSASGSASATSPLPSGSPASGVGGLGTAQTNLALTLTLAGVTVPAGALLVVTGSVVGSSETITVKFGTTFMTLDAGVLLPMGAPLTGSIWILSAQVGGQTGDIVLSVNGGVAAALTIQAVAVSGLSTLLSDQLAAAAGLASQPDSGPTGTPASANEYAQGAFLMLAPGGAWVWENNFTSGGQDVSETVAGVAASVTEGYQNLAAIAAVQAALGGVTPAAWAGLAVTYR